MDATHDPPGSTARPFEFWTMSKEMRKMYSFVRVALMEAASNLEKTKPVAERSYQEVKELIQKTVKEVCASTYNDTGKMKPEYVHRDFIHAYALTTAYSKGYGFGDEDFKTHDFFQMANELVPKAGELIPASSRSPEYEAYFRDRQMSVFDITNPLNSGTEPPDKTVASQVPRPSEVQAPQPPAAKPPAPQSSATVPPPAPLPPAPQPAAIKREWDEDDDFSVKDEGVFNIREDRAKSASDNQEATKFRPPSLGLFHEGMDFSEVLSSAQPVQLKQKKWQEVLRKAKRLSKDHQLLLRDLKKFEF